MVLLLPTVGTWVTFTQLPSRCLQLRKSNRGKAAASSKKTKKKKEQKKHKKDKKQQKAEKKKKRKKSEDGGGSSDSECSALPRYPGMQVLKYQVRQTP